MGSYGTPIIPFGVILGKADKISIANEEIQVLHPTYSCGVGYNCVRFPFAPAAVAVALLLPKMVLKCLPVEVFRPKRRRSPSPLTFDDDISSPPPASVRKRGKVNGNFFLPP